eukprot:jgi/Bigna1/84514/fgenesh1_pg.145_\
MDDGECLRPLNDGERLQQREHNKEQKRGKAHETKPAIISVATIKCSSTPPVTPPSPPVTTLAHGVETILKLQESFLEDALGLTATRSGGRPSPPIESPPSTPDEREGCGRLQEADIKANQRTETPLPLLITNGSSEHIIDLVEEDDDEEEEEKEGNLDDEGASGDGTLGLEESPTRPAITIDLSMTEEEQDQKDKIQIEERTMIRYVRTETISTLKKQHTLRHWEDAQLKWKSALEKKAAKISASYEDLLRWERDEVLAARSKLETLRTDTAEVE